MISLIRWALRRWLRHQQDAIEGGAEASDGLDIAPQVCDQDAVDGYLLSWAGGAKPVSFEGNLTNSIEQANTGGIVKVNESCVRACDGRYLAFPARNNLSGVRSVGFIDHDGLPWLWEEAGDCFLPVTQTNYADAYAKLQMRAPFA